MKKLILLLSLFFFFMTSAQEKKEINTDTKMGNIEKQISDLQKQIKVLEEQQLDKSKEIENTYKNNIEIIEKVEGFYNRSWEKLIFLITVLGVVVPSIITWWQNRNFNKEQEKFKNQLAETEKNFRKELRAYYKTFQKQLDDNYKTFQEQLENKIAETEQKLKTLFNREYDKLKQEVSNNVMKMNEALYNEINKAKYFNFLTQADVNMSIGDYNRVINCLGAALEKSLGMNLSKNDLKEVILFVIGRIEEMITYVSEGNINIDLSSYKEHKEDTLNSLNHILTSNILPEESKRIQKIINFIENH